MAKRVALSTQTNIEILNPKSFNFDIRTVQEHRSIHRGFRIYCIGNIVHIDSTIIVPLCVDNNSEQNILLNLQGYLLQGTLKFRA